MSLTRKVCLVLCRSGRFETGQGACAAICMDQLGDARKKSCNHIYDVHAKLAADILLVVAEEVGMKAAER